MQNNQNRGYGNNRNNNKNQRNSANDKPVVPMPEKIVLDYTKDIELFGNSAQKWSKKLEADSDRTSNKINQIRGFYDKVLELNEKAQNKSNDEYKKEVYPFVIMLKSKVAYAKTRGLVSSSFVIMISNCVEEASGVKEMNNFKLFFEALIGFYPKK